MEMELARPHIFLSGHASHLEDALGCYMDMIDSYLYNWDSFKWIIEVKSINDIQIKFNFSNISIMFRCIQFLISWQDAEGFAGVAIENNVNTVQHIVNSINMLNMQAGNN